MIDVNIHNIQRVTSQTMDVTHVGPVGVLRLKTDRGEASLFMTPAQAKALAEAWHRASDPAPVEDDAAVAAYRQLEAEDAERDDTFAELQEMVAVPKETEDA